MSLIRGYILNKDVAYNCMEHCFCFFFGVKGEEDAEA